MTKKADVGSYSIHQGGGKGERRGEERGGENMAAMRGIRASWEGGGKRGCVIIQSAAILQIYPFEITSFYIDPHM